jgi:hypothetical protein
VRLTLLEALSAAAEEISAELAPGSIDVRLRGGTAGFVVTPPPAAPAADDAPGGRAEVRLPAADVRLAASDRTDTIVEVRPGGRAAYADYVAPAIILMAVAAAAQGTAIAVAQDMAEGIIARFRTMAVARSAVLTGQVVGATIQTLIGVVVVTAAALAVGFRPNANAAEWLDGSPSTSRSPRSTRCCASGSRGPNPPG